MELTLDDLHIAKIIHNLLQNKYKLFEKDWVCRPLDINIKDQISLEGVSEKDMQIFYKWWTSRNKYLAATIITKTRFNSEHKTAGVISEGSKLNALRQLVERSGGMPTSAEDLLRLVKKIADPMNRINATQGRELTKAWHDLDRARKMNSELKRENERLKKQLGNKKLHYNHAPSVFNKDMQHDNNNETRFVKKTSPSPTVINKRKRTIIKPE